MIPHRQWNSGGTGITVTLNIDYDFLHRKVNSLGYCLNNAIVCLMRNHPIHGIVRQIVAFQYLQHVITHTCNGISEYRTTFLVNVMQVMIDSKMRRWTYGTARFHVQVRKSLSVGTEKGILNTKFLFLSGFH